MKRKKGLLLPENSKKIKDHLSPLITALRQKDETATRSLLEKKEIDVNLANDAGDTALHVAIGKGFVAGVKLLLVAGADVNAVNNAGLSPLTMVIKNGNKAIADLLAPTATVRFLDLRLAVERGLAALLGTLSFDPNLTDKRTGKTALMFGYPKSAAVRLAIIELFLQRGYALGLADIGGWTVLSYEVSLGSYENVQYLLSAGATVENHMFAEADTEELQVLLETWVTTKGLLTLDPDPAIEKLALAVPDDAQVFDPLMYCECDLRDIDLAENVVFAVLDGATGGVSRWFAYYIPQLEKMLARQTFIFECAAEVTGSCPQVKDIAVPFVPYIQLMEASTYGVRADQIQKILRDKKRFCALLFDRSMPFVSSLRCIQIRYGFNYKGKMINVASRLHGKEGNDLNAYTVKIIDT